MLEIKVYENERKTKQGDTFSVYTAKIKETNEWVDIKFAKDCELKPESSCIICVENRNIFRCDNLSQDQEKMKLGRKAYMVTKVNEIKPLYSNIIEDDFFA